MTDSIKNPKAAAKRLASYGRYGDSVLVHMNPVEVEYLAKMSPTGKLTINPDTGQPEAFLPLLLGALGGLLGGAALPSALGISAALGAGLGGGLGTFGGSLAEGKDVGTSLGKGILSGLTGYGLGSAVDLLGSAAGSGMDAATSEGLRAAADSGQIAAMSAPTAGTPSVPSESIMGPIPLEQYSTGSLQNSGLPGALGGYNVDPQGGLQPQSWGASAMDRYGRAAEGLTDPSKVWNTFGKNALKTTVPAGLGIYGMTLPDEPQGMQPVGGFSSSRTPTIPGPNQRKYIPAPGDWDYSTGKEWNYWTPAFNSGGPVRMPQARGVKPWKPFDEMSEEHREHYLEEVGKHLSDELPTRDPFGGMPRARNPFNTEIPPTQRFDDGGEVGEWLPATEKDWQSARPGPDGKLEYLKRNPEFSKKMIKEAQDKVDYLNDLTRRQAPWTLHPSLVGKGLTESGPMNNVMRGLSRTMLGQPYGFMSPPTQRDFRDAQEEVDRRKGYYNYQPQRYRSGGPVSGPGNGLSDSIPAVIDGRTPAALSSGEWVAPAHLVSALGNGSTESGVRELEGMADRVLSKKFGSPNRKPKPINPRRMLPA